MSSLYTEILEALTPLVEVFDQLVQVPESSCVRREKVVRMRV